MQKFLYGYSVDEEVAVLALIFPQDILAGFVKKSGQWIEIAFRKKKQIEKKRKIYSNIN